MKFKMDFNKAVYIVIAFLLIIIVIIAVTIAGKNKKEAEEAKDTLNIMEEMKENMEAEKDENGDAVISEISEGDLPSAEELEKANLSNVMQSNKINDQFNLYMYEIIDEGIKYSYLANAVTNGERLSITAVPMSEEEYNEMLPTSKVQNNVIDNINVCYNDRNLYYTIDESNVPEYIANGEKEGNVVVRYGNSTSEFLPMQQIMWYSDGIGYTLESISRNYTYEDMSKLLQDFFNSVK